MRKPHLLFGLGLFTFACAAPPSDNSDALERELDCEVQVSFGAEAVSVSGCADRLSLELVHADGSVESGEYARAVTLAQEPGKRIVSIIVEDEGGLDLQYDDPNLEHDLIPVEPDDDDGDGRPADVDCDDSNPLIGALLYESEFETGYEDDDGYLALGPKLHDPWWFDGEAHTTDGGQQALIGEPEAWTNTVTFGKLRLSGIDLACGHECFEDHTRFRAGYLARVSADADQDEGFHGYRCAVARNSGEDCFDPGQFVQLAAFLDGPEDDYNSECTLGCPPNPTFDQLDRVERSKDTDLVSGDSAELVFWVHEQNLVCEFHGNGGEVVYAKAEDDRFTSGTTGLSTLNGLTDFEYIKVCEAFGTP